MPGSPDLLAATVLTPSDFVALLNQTLEFAYPAVVIEGEITEFRVRKNQWVYFKIKDEGAVVDCFTSVYTLKQPLEDGMLARVSAQPRLHPAYGFSLNVSAARPIGEGAIRRAFELLRAKLEAEGLFDPARKRPLPGSPGTIGLISSREAAGAEDFLTVLGQRWPLARVLFAHTAVQGETAVGQIVAAIDYFNQLAEPVDVLVLVRGGGSMEDLQVFNTEPVARAVAASRTPMIVGVGHEQDVTLADLAADVRAVTPTQAAQLAAPDRRELSAQLAHDRRFLEERIQFLVADRVGDYRVRLQHALERGMGAVEARSEGLERTLRALDPRAALKRGYALVRDAKGGLVRSARTLAAGDTITAEFADGEVKAEVR